MRRAAVGLAGLLLAFLPDWAEAHRLDGVVQGAYLTLAPEEVRLELDVSPGLKVAAAFLSALDTDVNRTISGAEAQGYARRALAQSTLTLDGKAASWNLEHVDVPPYQNLEAGSGTIRIHAKARRGDIPGAHVLEYRNDHQPAGSRWMANVFATPAAGRQYRVTRQQHSNDGRQLTVSYTVVPR
jgi:hypothetical protein